MDPINEKAKKNKYTLFTNKKVLLLLKTKSCTTYPNPLKIFKIVRFNNSWKGGESPTLKQI
jgi:hypothetical protein